MRSLLLRCVVLWVGSMVASYASAEPVKPTRTAQLIVMSAGRPPPTEVAEGQQALASEEKGGGARSTGISESNAPFRVHDLSRGWVEFEMRNSFASAGLSAVPADTEIDPFAHVGVARVGVASLQTAAPAPPAIPIPPWMRSGMAFAAAATQYAPGCGVSAYRPAGFLSTAAENRRFGYYALMSSIACEYGIPTGLFDAMIIRESGYQASIYSSKNAFGLTQLMPDTAQGLVVDRYDLEQNLRGGAKYLKQQLDRFGQVHLALAAYNAGPGRVRNGFVPRIAETQAYVESVLLNWRRLAGVPEAANLGMDASQQSRRPMPAVGRAVRVSTF